MFLQFRTLWIVSLILITFWCKAASGQEYAIKLSPTFKKGDKFHYTAVVVQTGTNETTHNTEVLSTDSRELAAEFEAIATVLEATAAGKAISTSYEIVACSLVRGEDEVTNLPKGAIVLDARKKSSDAILINGKAASKPVEEILNLFLIYTDAAAASDNDIIGTTKKVKIGETWDINREALIRDYRLSNPDDRLGEVSGSSTLVGLDKFDGKDALFIKSKISMTDYAFPLPEHFRIIDSRATFKFEIKAPVGTDFSSGEVKSVMRLIASASTHNEEGIPVMVNIDVERMVLQTFTKMGK